MTHRITVAWPDAGPFEGLERPIRILAASDEPDRTLEVERNRSALGPIDAIVGCGDLEPSWLAFLGDAFAAPLLRVLGNHDREHAELDELVPQPLRADVTRHFPVPLVGLSWAGDPPQRGDGAAWAQALRVLTRRLLDRTPVLVASHVPPTGLGDGPDAYHRGYDAYLWLMRRLRPPLWLHGHTTLASRKDWQIRSGRTLVVNVTGSVLVELTPPAAGANAAAAS